MNGLMNFDDELPPLREPIPQRPGMPQPQAAQLPPIVAPAQPRMSLLSRIGHALSAAGGGVSDFVRPEAPAGYGSGGAGLTPEEIESARPNLLRSIIHAPDELSAGDQYRKNLDGIVERKGYGVQMQRQKEIMTARQGLAQRFPAPVNGSEEDIAAWVNKVTPFLVQAGDFDGAKMLMPLVAQFAQNSKPSAGRAGEAYVNDKGETRYFDKTAGSVVPAGWSKMKSDSSGGTAQLFVGPRGASQQEWVTPGDDAKLAQLAKQGYRQAVTARSEFVQGNVMARADRVDERVRVNSFNTQTKPLRERAAVIDQAIRTIDDAAHNPDPRVRKTLYSSAVANFVQAADQKAQIRYQLLNYFKDNVDPSIAGKWSLLKSRLLDGTLPEYTMEGMLIHLQNLREMTAEHYNAQRSGMIERHPELEESLPSVEEFFPENGAGITKPAGNSGAKPSVADRDAQLKASGMKASERLKTLKAEGYNVR